MATTAKGTPYVVSTDLVANYPTVSSDLATHIDSKLAYNAVSINAQTGTTYTFALADASEGKLVTASNAAASTYTVPPQSSVTWAAGAVLRVLNQGAGTVTIAAGSGVTINGTPLTLAQYKGAAIQKTGTDTWTFIPFSGGVGSAVISSPAATGSYSSGGTTYNYYTFTASGTLTVDAAGIADVLVVGGGGGAVERTSLSPASRAGGGGGGVRFGSFKLSAGNITVTVGGGGAGSSSSSSTTGNVSKLVGVLNAGPGGGCVVQQTPIGAQVITTQSGGGGGAGGISITTGGGTLQKADGGGAGGTADGANAMDGTSSSITGSSVTYGTGGDKDGSTAGGSNTGDGGDAIGYTNGGSGVVIVRVAV